MASRAMAKVRAKTKEALTGLSGYPGIFSHLAGEHAEVASLMHQVGSSGEAHTADELFPEIRKKLLAHAKAEEKEFYAPLRNAPPTKALVAKATEQHKQIEAYVEELHDGSTSTKAWMTTFEKFMHAVEKHVEMEEHQLFPAAKDVLSNQQAKELERRYSQAEEQQKAHL